MLIDTHMHLEDENVSEYIKRAKDNGINTMILGGTSREENDESIKLINEYKELYFTIGYHPEFCNKVTKDDINYMESCIKKNNKIVGIGEIGIDLHYSKEDEYKQIEWFEKQLDLAEKYNLPVVIHTRDAIEKTYEVLKRHKVIGTLHCFSGSLEMAKKFIDLGFYLGIGGVVTFENSNLKDVVKAVSLDNIVFETDSPYLSPFRGQKNESANIKYICDYVAKLKDLSYEKVEKITTNNALKLFDFSRNL